MIRLVVSLVLLGMTPLRGAGIAETAMPPIREAMQRAIGARIIPGGVLCMGHSGDTHLEAFGARMIDPVTKVMEKNTIFDAASITKVVVTAPLIALLCAEGKIALHGTVATYLPEFTGGGKEHITLRMLLTHTSGTKPSIRKDIVWNGYQSGVAMAVAEPLKNIPGISFVYSDINYILLGEIIRRVTGQSLDNFAATRLFKPLGMKDTGYLPSRWKRDRIAPTTREAEGLIHGVVHDPTCRRMGGIAGHAGLFTTASDLAIYCRMLLQKGRSKAGRQIVSESAWRQLCTPVELPQNTRRTMGFDVESPYADARGQFFGPRSFGHTGWTGTSLWIDPDAAAFVILLTNRNHPDEHASVKDLRFEISTLATTAMGMGTVKKNSRKIGIPQRPRLPCAVKNGVDTLEAQDFAVLQNMRLGLITNHTGRTASDRSTIDLLASAPSVKLTALFSPEHGIRGLEDHGNIKNDRDEKTGLPIFSLYGKSLRPDARQMQLVDALVFDIQDIGCRFYTYIGTMKECMTAAADHGKQFIVLDRINPINGVTVSGPIVEDTARKGAPRLVACHALPLRHGMTAGELAKLFVKEVPLKLHLTVVPVTGWNRHDMQDATGLPWINPSPNMRSLDAAVLYPGVALLEFCNVSVGRGTETPFLLVGAPWVDASKLAAALRAISLPGLTVEAADFTPTSSVLAGKLCHGVRFIITDRARVPSVTLGIALGRSLQINHPQSFQPANIQKLLCHGPVLNALKNGTPVAAIESLWQSELAAFCKRRDNVLIYR